ncbi:MAG: SiaB family protein kinase [Cyclobacteriaceae bacterium]|nr:SiaB family protein kinase [Cyclobacteriaceae bacterium]
MKYIYDLHRAMRDQSLILLYEGEFTQETIKSVLAMAERNMDSSAEGSSTKRKVFNVMVELLQNIVKHSDELVKQGYKDPSAIFMIGRTDDRYAVMSGNPIKNANIEAVQGKLDKVNSLDKDGLKEYYKEIIKSTTISEKGGAGLGFVDMARKSGNKIGYEFHKVDDHYSFFCLESTIDRTE